MTFSHERRKPNLTFNILVTAALGVMGYMAIAMWNSKASVLDLQSMDSRYTVTFKELQDSRRLDFVQDSTWKANEHALLLEILCHQTPHSRRCTNGGNN